MRNPFKELVDAEDFFEFYNVPFHPEMLAISRVHILKKFRMYLEEEGILEEDTSDKEVWKMQRAYLFRAYREFIEPTPVRQKFFSTFYQSNGIFIPFEKISKRSV